MADFADNRQRRDPSIANSATDPVRDDRNDLAANPDIKCSSCPPLGKALVGDGEDLKPSRMKCRKCNDDYWETYATGMVQQTLDEGLHEEE